ncbi:curli-like amyloid fiber formation chaperone CsgH [Rhizobium tubonense]|uniref:Uncharacterized protein n=1 Tax=Rhizobium tubonense TaxID=484088 RepID=A0A2W4C9Z3_9HYPH|nr:curli-like amyloid fiber formation chaperone CsgH [Rhizobium tubonense]PZM08178.1 hypothetical protein CPY51_29600 [Rhizobium tubonense]
MRLRFKELGFLLASSSAVLLAQNSGAASMNGQTIFGTTNDPRIQRCGIHVIGEDWLSVTPFIETAEGFDGSFDLGVTKTSKAGSSQTRQSNHIKAGVLSGSRIWVDRPARIDIEMNVKDDGGKVVCRLTQAFSLPEPATKL